LFVSSNGFAEYFGAPRGELLKGNDQVVEPALRTKRMPRNQKLSYQMLGLATLCGLVFIWIVMKRKMQRSI
jgi:hypothetical protein